MARLFYTPENESPHTFGGESLFVQDGTTPTVAVPGGPAGHCVEIWNKIIGNTSAANGVYKVAAAKIEALPSIAAFGLTLSSLQKTMTEKTFRNYEGRTVMVPQGFNGQFVGYIALLNTLLKRVSGLEALYLKPMLSWFRELQSMPTAQMYTAALRTTCIAEPDVEEYDRLSNEMSAYFKPVNGVAQSATASMGSVFCRVADFIDAEKDARALADSFSNIDDHEKILKLVKQIDLSVLSLLSRNAKVFSANLEGRQAADSIAHVLLVVAREVELYSTVVYRVTEALNCIENMREVASR